MSSIGSLERRIRRLVSQLEPEQRTWCFALEPGEDIPAEIAAQFGPRDTVIVQELPDNYLLLTKEEQAEEGRP